jgi:choline dehydrogenase-like flavoprotein
LGELTALADTRLNLRLSIDIELDACRAMSVEHYPVHHRAIDDLEVVPPLDRV